MVSRKTKIALFVSALLLSLLVGRTVVQAKSHSKAYKDRVNQLLELDDVYQNKDG